jgi:hypothetical protein
MAPAARQGADQPDNPDNEPGARRAPIPDFEFSVLIRHPSNKFITPSSSKGILRLFTSMSGRLYFIQQFSVILEMNRCLANLSTHDDEMHETLASEHVIAFLGDTLQFSFAFLHGIYTKPTDEKARIEKEKVGRGLHHGERRN